MFNSIQQFETTGIKNLRKAEDEFIRTRDMANFINAMDKTNEKLAPSCPGAKLLHGKVFNAYSSKADLSAWVETLSL